MKKNMIKVLAMAAATVMLTGCGNQYAEDISAIFGDGMQVAEAVKVKVTEEVKVVKEPKIVEETEPKVAAIDDVDKGAAAEAESASTTPPAKAKPESTAKPAETKPTAATAPAGTKPAATTPSAGQKSAPTFQCLCGFVANTEEELYNHIISETFGPGTEAQPVVTKPVETKPAEAQPVEAQPAEAQPAENQPTENQPAETQPTENQPAAATAPAETQPVHPNMWDHEWKKHVTTGEHYEKVCVGTLYTCGVCDYETDNHDDILNHVWEHATDMGSLSNGLGATISGNYGMQDIYENQLVYGEYVDYDYCDCGATTPVGVRYTPIGVDTKEWWDTHDWYATED